MRRTAVRNLCNFSLRTASGPEGSSAKQILTCAAGPPGRGGVRTARLDIDFSTVNSDYPRCPIRSSRASGGRSGSTTSSASRRSRGRCATRSRAAGSRRRSCSPGRAASARRRRRASWRARSTARTGRRADPCGVVRRVRRDRRGPRHRRARDRRRHAHRRRQRPRGDHRRPGDRAGAQPLQGLHHRRSPPALGAVVQRAAEVDRGAAAARRLHDGDDRARQDSRHGAVAVAGLRVPDDQRRRRSPTSCGRIVDAEQHRGRRRGAAAASRATPKAACATRRASSIR